MTKNMISFGTPLSKNVTRTIMGGAPRPPWEGNPFDPDLGWWPIDDPYHAFCQLQCPAGNWLFCSSGESCQPNLTANTLTCGGIINYC
jgi:hypothetical protein